MNINKLMALKNREFAQEVKIFNQYCQKAGIEPTKRQAGKWRKKRGMAYLMKAGIKS